MAISLALLLGVALLGLCSLCILRALDHRSDRVERVRLLALRQADPPLFSHSMVRDLPEPARRYFHFTIAQGTPLHRVAQIDMQGQFGLGTKRAPNYLPMTAKQVLAAPEGFIWKMSGGAGVLRISGSDSAGWTRFWLAGLIPVARAGGTPDHALSGFARYISEAVFWTPAAVLPAPGIDWTAVDDNTARLTVTHKGQSQSVDITLDPDGRPVRVSLCRWSNANKDAVYRFQPFGGILSEFRDFDGFCLPTHVEGGNMFGTDDYFPFYIADVQTIRFCD